MLAVGTESREERLTCGDVREVEHDRDGREAGSGTPATAAKERRERGRRRELGQRRERERASGEHGSRGSSRSVGGSGSVRGEVRVAGARGLALPFRGSRPEDRERHHEEANRFQMPAPRDLDHQEGRPEVEEKRGSRGPTGAACDRREHPRRREVERHPHALHPRDADPDSGEHGEKALGEGRVDRGDGRVVDQGVPRSPKRLELGRPWGVQVRVHPVRLNPPIPQVSVEVVAEEWSDGKESESPGDGDEPDHLMGPDRVRRGDARPHAAGGTEVASERASEEEQSWPRVLLDGCLAEENQEEDLGDSPSAQGAPAQFLLQPFSGGVP